MTSVVSLAVVLVLSSLFIDLTWQCMPGASSGRRRHHRKHGRLLYKQRIPNLSETSLGSSGESEGPVDRSSERFNELVVNGNTDIVFKESVSNVRIMSERCKDRLNSLSIMVMNTWPGVKLRVIKAWEETPDFLHSDELVQSLHQDGRAVDITTSDRDREKLGVLAGLAVDAGFDWVYYESRNHIHCSVKPDSYITSKMGGCFSSRDFVQLENGTTVSMDQLTIGDQILTIRPDGRPSFNPVIAFLHRNPSEPAQFVILRTTGGSISLTFDHLIFTCRGHDLSDMRTQYAGDIEVGQFLCEVQPIAGIPTLISTQVIDKSYKLDSGVFAPLTAQGTIVVSGHLASCYGIMQSHRLAHAAFFPIRLTSGILSSNYYLPGAIKIDPTEEGVHWYAALLYRVFSSLLPAEFWYRQ